MLKCCGCGDICLAEQVLWTDGGGKEFRFYPPPVSRKRPTWLFSLIINTETNHLAGLLNEIYEATYGGQNRLAAMGIRALLEQIIITKVGDHGTFEKNLNIFYSSGYISLVQRDALSNVLEVGHGAMHRGFAPKSEDIVLALDIVEGVVAPIFHHQKASEEAARTVPPRPPRK